MPHRRGLTAARPKVSGPLWVTACLAIQCHQPPSWLLPEKFSAALQAKKLETRQNGSSSIFVPNQAADDLQKESLVSARASSVTPLSEESLPKNNAARLKQNVEAGSATMPFLRDFLRKINALRYPRQPKSPVCRIRTVSKLISILGSVALPLRLLAKIDHCDTRLSHQCKRLEDCDGPSVRLDFLLIQPDLHIGRSGHRLRLNAVKNRARMRRPLMVINVFQNSGT